MNRVARLLCLLAVLPLAGCYYPDYVLRPEIVHADANGIAIRAGRGVNPYNMAALHCQRYGKLSVPHGTQASGQYVLTWFYVCQ
ncbi:MAG: hypothetical protein ACREEL_12315 [Stellaceae bacterium]